METIIARSVIMTKIKDIGFIKEIKIIGTSIGIIFSKEEAKRYNIKVGSKVNLDDMVVLKNKIKNE